MGANNETGVIQPIAEIARLARWAGALFHCDAAQCVGRIPLNARDADLLTVSAHKLGGPQGVGALVARSEATLRPDSAGGQEGGLRPGTENVAGIVGFGVAIQEARSELGRWAELADLRDRAAAALQEIDPAATVYGAAAPRLPNTLCIAMPGVPAETQVIALDLAGVAVSAGAACSSGKVRASHVLGAMGVPPAVAGTAIRISLGPQNSVEDIDRLAAAWAALRRRTWERA
jgi:cysteine desulfurase